jgi:hypothetical protein
MANGQKANRFERGSGCYSCSCCQRLTRSTGRGDNENCGLCEECFEVGGIENEIADGHYRSDAERAEWEAQIEKLNAQCRAKGGKV